MEGWAGTNVKLTDNYTQQLQRGSLWRPKQAWEAHPPALERWAEATGSDRPDSDKREAGGRVGRRKKGYFKAHKITVNWTAQDEHWLLPKLCRFVQILCKLATQRWQGALTDSLALESSQSVSLSLVQGVEELSPTRQQEVGDRICPIPVSCQLSLWGSLPNVRPSTLPFTFGFFPRWLAQR